VGRNVTTIFSIDFEDWIIIRLLCVSIRSDDKRSEAHPEVIKALDYLLTKYGLLRISWAIDQLKQERTQHEETY
jgi:hypothetical protein